jgi:hypothetical protein
MTFWPCLLHRMAQRTSTTEQRGSTTPKPKTVTKSRALNPSACKFLFLLPHLLLYSYIYHIFTTFWSALLFRP